jgi:hypothetical protein
MENRGEWNRSVCVCVCPPLDLNCIFTLLLKDLLKSWFHPSQTKMVCWYYCQIVLLSISPTQHNRGFLILREPPLRFALASASPQSTDATLARANQNPRLDALRWAGLAIQEILKSTKFEVITAMIWRLVLSLMWRSAVWYTTKIISKELGTSGQKWGRKAMTVPWMWM